MLRAQPFEGAKAGSLHASPGVSRSVPPYAPARPSRLLERVRWGNLACLLGLLALAVALVSILKDRDGPALDGDVGVRGAAGAHGGIEAQPRRPPTAAPVAPRGRTRRASPGSRPTGARSRAQGARRGQTRPSRSFARRPPAHPRRAGPPGAERMTPRSADLPRPRPRQRPPGRRGPPARATPNRRAPPALSDPDSDPPATEPGGSSEFTPG